MFFSVRKFWSLTLLGNTKWGWFALMSLSRADGAGWGRWGCTPRIHDVQYLKNTINKLIYIIDFEKKQTIRTTKTLNDLANQNKFDDIKKMKSSKNTISIFFFYIRFNILKSLCEFYILRENQHSRKNHLPSWYTLFYLSCTRNIYLNVWCFYISCLFVLIDTVRKLLLRSTIKLLLFQRNFQKFKLHWVEVM